MEHLLGEYDCKLDAKGRFVFPVGLRKQLGDDAVALGFVLNRDIFEPCLVMYPRGEWKRVSEQIAGLNRFVRKNAVFIRRFNAGATPVAPDGAGRVLLPKGLMEYAGFEKELKVVGNGERIELWDKKRYLDLLSEDLDFASLSEEVMGGAQDDA